MASVTCVAEEQRCCLLWISASCKTIAIIIATFTLPGHMDEGCRGQEYEGGTLLYDVRAGDPQLFSMNDLAEALALR